MKKIKLYINTGFVNCKHEDFQDLPDDWEEMGEEEREKYLDEVATDFLQNLIEYGAYLIDGDKQDGEEAAKD